MTVKFSLDKEMSDWLQAISENECRSNASQVLYWLKQIKNGTLTLDKGINVAATQEVSQPVAEIKPAKEDEPVIEEKNIEDEQNLAEMLDFV